MATANAGKLRELRALLGPLGWQVAPQSEHGVSRIEETGRTLVENALLKARHAAECSGLPALADDSGIEVDALGGRPGAASARYAGPNASDTDNNRKLLEALRDVPEERRTARFRCVLALVRSAADPAPLVCEGTWEGRIAAVACGANGFGYDPLFIVAGRNLSSAQLDPVIKNAESHRARALTRLAAALRSMREK